MVASMISSLSCSLFSSILIPLLFPFRRGNLINLHSHAISESPRRRERFTPFSSYYYDEKAICIRNSRNMLFIHRREQKKNKWKAEKEKHLHNFWNFNFPFTRNCAVCWCSLIPTLRSLSLFRCSRNLLEICWLFARKSFNEMLGKMFTHFRIDIPEEFDGEKWMVCYEASGKILMKMLQIKKNCGFCVIENVSTENYDYFYKKFHSYFFKFCVAKKPSTYSFLSHSFSSFHH